MGTVLSVGLVRGLIWGLVGAGAGAGITVGVRAALGLSLWKAEPLAVVAALVGLVAYFAGLGAFTYWLRWALGTKEAEEHPGAPNGHRGYHWRRFLSFDTNHKVIGVQYTVTAILVLLVAGAASLLMRLELASSGRTVMGPGLYNAVMSFHGIGMIAFVLILNSGVINYLLPLMIGAKDMVFPRLNAFSFWFVPRRSSCWWPPFLPAAGTRAGQGILP